MRQRIRESTEKDDEVVSALETILNNGPCSLAKGLQEWNVEDGIILFRGKVYVPKDLKLCWDISQTLS